MEGMMSPGTLQQVHSRLSVPSSFSEGPPYDSSRRASSLSTFSSSTFMLKSPLRFQLDCTLRPRALPYRRGSCVASSSTVEPADFCYTKAMKPTTLYDVLGISDHMVTEDEIKAAFRRLAKEVHPDQAPLDQVKEYQEKFKSVYKAYSVLKDPRTRSLYDYEIRNSLYNSQMKMEDQKRPAWRGRNWETDQCWTS